MKPLFFLLILFTINAKANIFVERVTENDFSSVYDDVVWAIADQGLVIAHHSDVATMLNRTTNGLANKASNMMNNMMAFSPFNSQVAPNTNIYRHGVVVEFCSASLSALTTTANPNNILFCPFSVAIFQLRNEPNQVHVSYLRLSKFANDPQSLIALTKVENMLSEVVSEALD